MLVLTKSFVMQKTITNSFVGTAKKTSNLTYSFFFNLKNYNQFYPLN